MRYSDFKLAESRRLYETEQQAVSQTLDNIEQHAEENPEVIKVAKSAVAKVRAEAAKILAKLKKAPAPAQQQPAPQETIGEASAIDLELSSLREDIAAAEADIAAICKAMGDACITVVSNIKKFLESAYQRMEELVAKSKEAGAEQEFQGEKQFAAEFGQAIQKIAAKATGTLEALEAHYKQQAQELKDQNLDVDVEIKDAPEQTQVEKAVADTLTSVFSGAAYGGDTRAEQQEKRKLLQGFLKDCVKGIIALGPLMDQKQGNILDAFSKTKYSELGEFFNELLGKVPAGSGAGSWGPAELALSVVGTPVNKAEKGDLNIGGNRKIELKASRSAKSGGRINTPAIGTGNSGKGAYDAAFKPLAQKLKLKIRNGKAEYKATTKKGVTNTKYLKYTSWGPSLINNVINPAIMKSDISRSEVAQFVQSVALAPVIEDHKKDGAKRFNASKVVRQDGTIDPKAFVAEYIDMTMGFYAETDGVEEVLVINPVTGNFHVVDARDTATLHDKIEQGDIKLSSTYLDFTDTQSKASPQIGTD